MMASPLSRELRDKHDYYPRRLTVRKGDIVRITRGGSRDYEGKVIGVDMIKMNITIDGITYFKSDEKSVPKPVDPSNVEIIKLDLSDRRRKKKFDRIIHNMTLTEEEMKEAEEDIESTDSVEEDDLAEEEEDDIVSDEAVDVDESEDEDESEHEVEDENDSELETEDEDEPEDVEVEPEIDASADDKTTDDTREKEEVSE